MILPCYVQYFCLHQIMTLISNSSPPLAITNLPDDHFFHCWRLQDCSSCLRSSYPCSWCAIVRFHSFFAFMGRLFCSAIHIHTEMLSPKSDHLSHSPLSVSQMRPYFHYYLPSLLRISVPRAANAGSCGPRDLDAGLRPRHF